MYSTCNEEYQSIDNYDKQQYDIVIEGQLHSILMFTVF